MANLKDLIVSGSARILGNLYATLKGNADTATKLETPRTIRTNLASTSAPDFDGTTNITPGVTGTLPVANGGTGQTSIANIQAGKDADGNVISTTYATKIELDNDLDILDGKLSNCILEIPQNLKLEYNNGVVTLKAGSIITCTGLTYSTLTITQDITWNTSTQSNATLYLFITNSGNPGGLYNSERIEKIGSGDVLPNDNLQYSLFYLTTDKTIYSWSNNAWRVNNFAYPIAIIETDENTNITGFAKDSNGNDMIFNGAGFIGHHAFVYPNVKALIPDGLNADGSMKSASVTVNSLFIVECTAQLLGYDWSIGLTPYTTQINKCSIKNVKSKSEITTPWVRYYVESENGYWYDNTNAIVYTGYCPLLSYTYDGTIVTSFTVRQPVKLATTEMMDKIDSGTLLPNFDTMPVLKTIEFDTADSNWHTIFTRTNTETNPANLTDVLYFRMTVTGTSINQVIDYGVIFRGQLNYPIVISKQYPGTSDGNYTGSRYYRTLFPKNLNNGYDWSFEVLQNRNNNARHYKVEVFKTTSKITWTAGTATILNGTYHNSNQQGTETNAGYHINWLNGTVNQSSWTSNINGQLSKIINTNYPAGEALLANQFLFMNNNKYYPATNKALAVEPGFGIQVNITAYNINNDVGWDRIRQKCRIISLTNIPHDTLARGNPCYFRCTKDSEGNIYSDNYIATSMSAGYVWYYVGTAESASIINIDTTQSFFITLDNNEETTHINGKRINDKVFGGSISNCILDIPQNIKLELDANVLTLKAGSILTKTGSTYATITTTVDQTHTIPDTLEDGKYYIMSSNGGFWSPTVETEYSVTATTGRHVRSGSTLPSSGDASHDMFYLTTDKSIYFWSVTGGWQNRTESNNACYPLCIIEMKSGVASFAKDSNGNDMIFNSSGFIGHHAFMYPNSRLVLKPNGFNEDGSLASIVIKNNALRGIEMLSRTNCWIAAESNGSLLNWSAYETVKHYSDADFTKANARYYIEDKNRILFQHDNVISEAAQTPLLKYTSDGTIVTDFTIRQPIRLVTTEMLDEITNNIIPTSDKRNIGEIVQSTIPLNDAALHLLDGSLISGSGTYSAFVTYMSGLVSSHSNLFCSEADWQATYTEYGVCGKFVYNSTDNTIRLPYITGFIEGTLTESSLGNVTEAGLPNITGILGTSGYVGEQWSKDSLLTGAFYKDTSLTEKRISDDVTAIANKEYNFGFDASLSNDIYNNSNTVQPQSIKVFYYISLANTIKTDIEVDIDNIQTELNDTVRVSDLTEATAVVETYKSGTDWYRVWSDGWIEQGGIIHSESGIDKPVSLLKTMIDTTYTVALSYGDYTANNQYTIAYKNKTTQGFVIGSWWSTNSNLAGPCNWYVCGY